MQYFPIGIGLYRLHFQALEDFCLPPIAANVWRSVLGMQLKSMSEGKAAVPDDLPMPTSELYAYFMETPPPPDARLMRLYRQTPHPWLLRCAWREGETRLRESDTHVLPLTLFGKANDLLAVILLALSRAAAQGLGKQRGKMRLMQVEMQPDPGADESITVFEYGGPLSTADPWRPQTPELPGYGRLTLELQTPLRLVVQKKMLTPQRFNSPYPLLMNLVRRASMLCAFHGDHELQADYAALKQAAQRARLEEASLAWRDQHRWSSRTRQRVPLGGVTGHLRLDISEAPELWPFLWLGQWLHAGKGAVLGMGRYTLSPAAV